MLALTGTADKDTEKTVIGELLMKNPVKLYFAGAYNTVSYAGYIKKNSSFLAGGISESLSPFSSRLRRSLVHSRALTIPPATQAIHFEAF